jgi:hypothetical protein
LTAAAVPSAIGLAVQCNIPVKPLTAGCNSRPAH